LSSAAAVSSDVRKQEPGIRLSKRPKVKVYLQRYVLAEPLTLQQQVGHCLAAATAALGCRLYDRKRQPDAARTLVWQRQGAAGSAVGT
jgi:hypothetical protein